MLYQVILRIIFQFDNNTIQYSDITLIVLIQILSSRLTQIEQIFLEKALCHVETPRDTKTEKQTFLLFLPKGLIATQFKRETLTLKS